MSQEELKVAQHEQEEIRDQGEVNKTTQALGRVALFEQLATETMPVESVYGGSNFVTRVPGGSTVPDQD